MSDTDVSIPKIQKSGLLQTANETAAEIKRTDSTLFSTQEMTFGTRGANALAQVIDIGRLYDALPGTESQVVRAIALLKDVSTFLEEARKSEDPMEADRFIQRVQLSLPKLFAYRSIGDGFGVIVNSLHFVFLNLRGQPLTPEQINVIWRVLRELRTHPILSFQQGIQRVEEIEASGLDVDPPDIGGQLENTEFAEDE